MGSHEFRDADVQVLLVACHRRCCVCHKFGGVKLEIDHLSGLISPAGGRRPRWRRDGKELYYIAPGGFVMALPVALGPPLEVGAPVPLFRGEPEIENYDGAADGSRFLVSIPSERVRESPIRVILN